MSGNEWLQKGHCGNFEIYSIKNMKSKPLDQNHENNFSINCDKVGIRTRNMSGHRTAEIKFF